MYPRTAALALTLTATPWHVPGMATAVRQASPWLRTDSPRFEVHYLPAQAGELQRTVRSAERAYDRIGTRLNFVLGTKVPLVMFDPADPPAREQAVSYAASEHVAPHHPHRSRLMLPLPDSEGELDAVMVHELTHLLACEVILPGRSGDGGLPRWVHEGIARYMVGVWNDADERLMRELVAARRVPALSQLSGTGGFANPRLNDVLGHAAFDYLESRWGPASTRRFLDALIVPRVDRTFDSVLGLTPAAFDEAFRQYAERRFGQNSALYTGP